MKYNSSSYQKQLIGLYLEYNIEKKKQLKNERITRDSRSTHAQCVNIKLCNWVTAERNRWWNYAEFLNQLFSCLSIKLRYKIDLASSASVCVPVWLAVLHADRNWIYLWIFQFIIILLTIRK